MICQWVADTCGGYNLSMKYDVLVPGFINENWRQIIGCRGNSIIVLVGLALSGWVECMIADFAQLMNAAK